MGTENGRKIPRISNFRWRRGWDPPRVGGDPTKDRRSTEVTIAVPPSRNRHRAGWARSGLREAPKRILTPLQHYTGQSEGTFRFGPSSHGITAARCSVIGHTLVQHRRRGTTAALLHQHHRGAR
ncbi:uncharacterized protein LOC120904412 [Anopheles arabiensis]|uniref:uncharacterized protein LOC120904412 n=1 Tax=Anopheles arabiensis TaxID=7173 RepID=UPI001AAD621B|nr:uncharacterized protein LOC120904412 [Anopheles arabiensis]